jgi:hypothetical protein
MAHQPEVMHEFSHWKDFGGTWQLESWGVKVATLKVLQRVCISDAGSASSQVTVCVRV